MTPTPPLSGAPKRHRWWLWAAAGAGAVLIVAVGGPFVYIHLVEGPPPKNLSLPGTGTATAAQAGTAVDGTWDVVQGSEVGYRVQETLVGQANTAVGRTGEVSGRMAISGSSVTSAAVTVNMASVTSNEGIRDDQFRGRVMDTARFPTAAFDLTRGMELGTIPAPGTVRAVRASGDLTLRGQTHAVTIPLQVERLGDTIEVLGSTNVVFADWGIPNPSNAVTKTASNGTLEFLLVFRHGAASAGTPGPAAAPPPTSSAGGFTPASPTTVPPLRLSPGP